MILTNKHVVAAFIITPILAILGYFAVDTLVSEKPHAAEDGGSYPLVAKSNCRYTSGQCEMKNGALNVRIAPQFNDNGTLTLTLTSNQPLQSAQFAVADMDQATTQPTTWSATDAQGTEWTATIQVPQPKQQLQLVVNASDSLFYGATELTFLNYQATFDEDFRRQ
ncbi:hypothetical protein [Halioxenophilus aromaticivorans]|uniref:Uncharacterized protein n=1 Tax=Halioxenophilus aromaticivorans TaxID=1306992 RepID=A0AAV3U4N5_9ALTE